jgi:hypothetical protein
MLILLVSSVYKKECKMQEKIDLVDATEARSL